MKQKFDVTGMTCASCASHVEKAVNKLPGTKTAAVNLMQNVLQIEYDDHKQSSEDIIQAIDKAGYGASVQGKKHTTSETSDVSDAHKEANSILKRLRISVVLLIPLMYIAMGEMIGLPLPSFLVGSENAITFAMVQFLLTLAIMYVNRTYFINGFKSLFHLAPTMDALIAIGSSAAVIYGIYAILMIGHGLAIQDFHLVHQYHMDIYFESAGTILTLITVGKYLETKSKGKTNDAIKKLMDLTPKTAMVERNNEVVEISIDDVVKGDIIIVKSGSSVPVDGVLTEGNATINESAITGESLPVDKQVNDTLTAGTISVSGYFKMKATRVGEDTTISQIIQLVEDANASKAPIAKLADKVSGVFVPVVISIAIIATAVWLLLGKDVSFALSIGIAVLIISCPCALGLATPTAIMVGTGKGAEHGILFKTAESLETMQSVNVIVLDKTGTLTEGKPNVTGLYPTDKHSEIELLQLAYDAESLSEHPLAKAIVDKATQVHLSAKKSSSFTQLAGQGLVVEMEGYTIYAGNAKLMDKQNIDVTSLHSQAMNLANSGQTPLYFAKDTTLIGMIALADTLKKNSKQAIDEFHALGIDVVLLTGDNKQTAQAIGNELGINTIISDVLPQDKESHVRKLIEDGKTVAMVGDGINDAPALARANVGLAIGAGTDIAMDSADIVLMRSDILDVVTTYQLSKATIKNIKENLFWAFIYNVIGIPVAAGLLYIPFGIKLNPMIGSGAMALSSVFVVSNALRLRFFKPKFHNHIKENNEPIEPKGETKMNKVLTIEGMSCNNCVNHVDKALNAIDGVEATVDLASNSATLTLSKEVSDDTLKAAVDEAGYKVTDIK